MSSPEHKVQAANRSEYGPAVGRPLVEIVPNFSEGRRQDVIEAIVRALLVPGVLLLNQQADPDHNRLDCTLIGPPDAVRRSALAGAAKAVELIDMDQHRGNHPRMGAIDVIPFVPVRDISMKACVELARELARELAATLDLPVYCYDRAALSEDRRSLAEVRRGEYEGIKGDVAAGKRLPDFGPRAIGKAGAVAVGARKLLIAFNVYLSGTEEAAKEIARAVRESSGGLPAIRAVGFPVPARGCVTVSMNLVDYEVTDIRMAFDAVEAEAIKRNMEVLSSEIVGLVPRATLGPGDEEHLRLEGFHEEEQILESVVDRAQAGEWIGALAVAEFLERLASESPTPGGGVVAALGAAAGAALIAMVARLTVGKKGYEGLEDRMEEIASEVDAARVDFLSLADRDAAAFDEVMAAFKLPKQTDEEREARSAAVQRAFRGAAEVPLEVARDAAALMDLALEVLQTGNATAASDAASAVQVLHAAVQSATYNVEINAASLRDAEALRELESEVESIRERSRAALQVADSAFRSRIE